MMHTMTPTTIAQCCEILDSKRIPLNQEQREKIVGDVPYYGANGLQGYVNDHIFDDALILLAEDGGYFDEYQTRPIAYRVSGPSWVNNHAHVLKAKDGFVQDYIFFALEHKNILPYIVGGTRSKLNQSELKSIKIAIPCDTHIQEYIALMLNRFDQAIEQTEAIIAKHQRIKIGMMRDLLNKGIDVNGQIRSEETHEFRESPLGRIPVEWDFDHISEFAEKITSGSRGWAKYYSEEGAVFIRIGNLTREHINLRLDEVIHVSPPQNTEGSRTKVRAGDILISITADLGIIGVIPENFDEAYINQHISLIRFDSQRIEPRWAGHYMQGQTFQVQVDKTNESGAKAGLNLPTVSRFLLAFPKLKEEQEAIIERIDHIDKSIVKYKRAHSKLIHLKMGLMHDLLAGKVPIPIDVQEEKRSIGATG